MYLSAKFMQMHQFHGSVSSAFLQDLLIFHLFFKVIYALSFPTLLGASRTGITGGANIGSYSREQYV